MRVLATAFTASTEQRAWICVREVVRVGDGFVRKLAVVRVNPSDKDPVALTGIVDSMICHHVDQFPGGVGERLGRGAGISRGHVRDAVMEDAFFLKDGVLVGCGPARFRATALVNGYVHQYAAGAHEFNHLPGY